MMQTDENDPTPATPEVGRVRTVAHAFRELALWKKTLFALAFVLFVSGVALSFLTEDDAASASSSGALAPGASTLIDGGTTSGGSADTTSGAADGVGQYSPGMVKIGFGFVAGLSLGLFLRNFLRLTLSFVGLIVLAILGLEYIGFVEVHWESMSQGFDNLAAGLGDQFRDFKTFVTGRIPASASAATGFYAGFRRK